MMNDKFFNRAIIGHDKMIASLSKKGELLRLCYPYIDGRQFFELFRCGVKINDSNIIYLHDDINNKYSQNYISNTNVLVTDIENTYFNLKVTQADFVCISKNVLVRKYCLENCNNIDLNINFLINSKINGNIIENFGSRIVDNGIIQYNHNYFVKILSDIRVSGYKLNDVFSSFNSGVINDKDYIGMSNEIGISFEVGILKPGEKRDFCIYIVIGEDSTNYNLFDNNIKINCDEELIKATNYWNEYVRKA